MSSIKKAIKGLFKRSSKDKQESTTPQTSSTPAATKVSPPAATTSAEKSQTTAPQLPPVQESSPLANASLASSTAPSAPPDTTKALPPTHPLATGQHTQPQEAVPINHNANEKFTTPPASPRPTSPPASPGSPSSSISRAIPYRPHSRPNSGEKMSELNTWGVVEGQFDDEKRTAELKAQQKAEGSMPVPEPLIYTQPAEAVTAPDGAIGPGSTNFANRSTDALALKENVQPTTIEAATALETSTAKPVKGMSATSGPLEDFPEGDAERKL